MAGLFQYRRDTFASWAAVNPILAQGEPGLELGTMKKKVGDGIRRWDVLPYEAGASEGIQSITAQFPASLITPFAGVMPWYPPSTVTLLDVFAAVGAPTTTDLVIDIKKNGSSIFMEGTKPVIPAGQKSSSVMGILSVSLLPTDYTTIDVLSGDGQGLFVRIRFSFN